MDGIAADGLSGGRSAGRGALFQGGRPDLTWRSFVAGGARPGRSFCRSEVSPRETVFEPVGSVRRSHAMRSSGIRDPVSERRPCILARGGRTLSAPPPILRGGPSTGPVSEDAASGDVRKIGAGRRRCRRRRSPLRRRAMRTAPPTARSDASPPIAAASGTMPEAPASALGVSPRGAVVVAARGRDRIVLAPRVPNDGSPALPLTGSRGKVFKSCVGSRGSRVGSRVSCPPGDPAAGAVSARTMSAEPPATASR